MDICMIAAIWILVYFMRFKSGWFSTAKGVSSLDYHISLIFPIIAICMLTFVWMGLYKPHRIESILKLVWLLMKVVVVSGLVISAFFYYLRSIPYSRNLIIVFIAMLYIALMASHLSFVAFLRFCRKKGYNQRYYAIIGTGTKAQQLVRDLNHMEWAGLKCRYFVDDNPALFKRPLMGIPVVGPIERMSEVVKS
jgi:FlaA1/EpsC-like NDP-sugar epimerase